MKIAVKRLIRDEKGQTLILALILLIVGGLIMTPLLAYMSTGLITGEVYERRTAELYAADAGVEDAIWKILNDPPDLPWADPDIGDVNEKVVGVSIEYGSGGAYKITSTATTDNNSSTTIESYVKPWSFLDNAITSMSDILLQNADIVGDVQYGGDLEIKNSNLDGEEIPEAYWNWPQSDELSSHYLEEVEGLEPYAYDSLDVAEHVTSGIGPLYRGNWDDPEEKLDLTIFNGCGNPTVALNGTVYVTGDLTFPEPGGATAYTIDLNGQTIFVEGNIDFPPHNVNISGSGCIIAIGDILFQPGMESNPDDFVFVMSIEGTIDFKPSGGTFYGSIAGDVNVDLKNASLYWQPLGEGKELNFPIEGYQAMKILTWEINPD